MDGSHSENSVIDVSDVYDLDCCSTMDTNECNVIIAGQLFIRCLFTTWYKKFTNVGVKNIEYDGEDLSTLSVKLIFIVKDYITYFRNNALPLVYQLPITILTEPEQLIRTGFL
ncbi:hypothetical protein CEXT_375161 [Caerostris extrusa]|uniref:Uncharacterized protein n=1 Tax=Caerostris extrusa TaxID=172846 RepID=A0AAV4UAJ5_CAEEX|nr:hypothetical protein CEXT_375161 [Caerostris extrusa]